MNPKIYSIMNKNEITKRLKAIYDKASQPFTAARLRTYKGFESVTDQTAKGIIEAIDTICEVLLLQSKKATKMPKI